MRMPTWLGVLLYFVNSLGWLALGYVLGRLAGQTRHGGKR
jgi:hypothetical protein